MKKRILCIAICITLCVSVLPLTAWAAPQITTQSLADATVGKEYYAKLECSDPDAVFSEFMGSQPEAQSPAATKEEAFPWWGYAVIVLGGIFAGIGMALIWVKQKKRQ